MMVWDEATHQVRAYILRSWYLVHMIYRRMLLTTYQKVSDCTSSAPHGFLRAVLIERRRPERRPPPPFQPFHCWAMRVSAEMFFLLPGTGSIFQGYDNDKNNSGIWMPIATNTTSSSNHHRYHQHHQQQASSAAAGQLVVVVVVVVVRMMVGGL